MVKCSKELVKRYINGDDITKYSLEELENDFFFMQQVIETTKDKKVYNLCSDELKDNYDFIKYVINKFKDDEKFICNVADDYMKDKLKFIDVNEEYSKNVIELCIIMSKTLKSKEYNTLGKYTLRVAFEYGQLRMGVERIKQNYEKEFEFYGMGFVLIKELYNGSNLILDDYAKRMINEIMENENVEKQFHNKYTVINKNSGLNTLAINYIRQYDQALADYISTNISLVKELTDKIDRIIKNWDIYNKREETKKYDLILEKFYECHEENNSDIDAITLLYYIGRKLKIEDKLKEYNKDYEEKVGYKKISDEKIKNQIINNIDNERVYKNCYKVIKDILNDTFEEPDLYILAEEQKKRKCKIIEFDSMKANN